MKKCFRIITIPLGRRKWLLLVLVLSSGILKIIIKRTLVTGTLKGYGVVNRLCFILSGGLLINFY